MSRSSTILLAFNVDWFALSHFSSYIKRFEQLGRHVHIFAEDTGSISSLSSQFVSVHRSLVGRRSGNTIQEILMLIYIGFSLLWLRPEIVECISIKPILTWGVWARLFNIKNRICYITGLGSFFHSSSVFLPFVDFLLRYALSGRNTRIIVENSSIQDLVVRKFSVLRENVFILNGVGVPLDVFYPSATGMSGFASRPIKILMASRLLKDKGVIEYLEAAVLLKQKYGEKVEFLLAGRFDAVNPTALSHDCLRTYLTPIGVVEYLGVSSDMPSLLRNINIFVLPSYHEGFPRSIIESAACGVPVVTTNVPGCIDAISHGTTGLAVPPRNVKLLVAAISHLIDVPSLLCSMSVESRTLALSKYDQNIISGNHLNIVLGRTN